MHKFIPATKLFPPHKIIIIGAGISGAATAYSLAKRGHKVIIYEKNASIANEASGNYQALLYGTFHGNYIPLTELHFIGLDYSVELIQSILLQNIDYGKSGLIQIFNNEESLNKTFNAITRNYEILKQQYLESAPEQPNSDQSKIGYHHNEVLDPFYNIKEDMDKLGALKSAPQEFCHKISANELQQIGKAKYGLYFPKNLWLHPKNLISKLLSHPNIKVILDSNIDELTLIENKINLRTTDTEITKGQSYSQVNNNNPKNSNHLWQLKSNGKILDETKTLILCNAHAANKFLPDLDLLTIRGQTTKIKAPISVRIPICNDSYILPTSNGYFTIGATFKPNNKSIDTNRAEHIENIDAIEKFFPEINDITKRSDEDNITKLEGHAAIRCSVKDYLPVVGPIAKYADFMTTYARLALDKNLKIATQCPYLPGLYLNIAHGSKGFITAPISGEIVAQYITGEKLIVNENVQKALDPNRLYLNKIIKPSTK